MKFISWNVNGLRAVVNKGFKDIFTELDADFFCLQETKLQEGQIDLELPGYKACCLDYRVLASKDGLTLVEVRLGTGRSHQIRAQMAHTGHPLIGDLKYGSADKRCKDIALEAYKLSFEHPVKRENVTFEAPVPSGFPWSLFA